VVAAALTQKERDRLIAEVRRRVEEMLRA